ncbi:MAG: PilZ domain-containing protein [Vicinamibacterales bacterium]
MSERRLNPRVKGPFEGYWDGTGVQQGRVVDLSVSGCFIEAVILPAEGQVVMVSISIGAGRIDLPSEVVYVERNQGFAVRFTEAPAAIIDSLRREIASRLPD